MPDKNSDASPERASRSVGARPDQGPSRGPEQDPDLLRLRQNQGRWKLSFSLFLLGFMLLIVVAKRSLPAGETWALRIVAAALCVGAFFLARQARRKPHA
jgi:hypothetical protein